MIDIAFAPPGLPTSGALALLVGEGARPAGVWAEADAATSGAVARGFEAAGFTGKKGQTCVLPGPGAGLSRIVAVGLGKPDAHTERDVEEAAGHAIAAMGRDEAGTIAADGMPASHAAAAASHTQTGATSATTTTPTSSGSSSHGSPSRRAVTSFGETGVHGRSARSPATVSLTPP